MVIINLRKEQEEIDKRDKRKAPHITQELALAMLKDAKEAGRNLKFGRFRVRSSGFKKIIMLLRAMGADPEKANPAKIEWLLREVGIDDNKIKALATIGQIVVCFEEHTAQDKKSILCQFAFCSPLDETKFSKAVGRATALWKMDNIEALIINVPEGMKKIRPLLAERALEEGRKSQINWLPSRKKFELV